MSSRSIEINIKINYPVIFLATLILHALFLTIRGLHGTASLNQFAAGGSEAASKPIEVNTIKNIDEVLKRIRTVGAKNAKTKDSTYLQKTNSDTKHVTADRFSSNPGDAFRPTESMGRGQKAIPSQKHPLSLKDLSMNKQDAKVAEAQKQASAAKPTRPGTRPEIAANSTRPNALQAIAMNGAEMKEFMRTGQTRATGASVGAGMDAASVSGDPRAASLSNSDVMVNLEVPEGVDPDELNKYELMFYGFQRRTAMNYVNSFYKRLDKFQAENPHIQFPMTETKQTMTGRLTYDREGNIKQIKMVRWSNVERLQDFFEQVLKDMDTLHNPPQALWDKTGEFSIFFSLVING